MGGGTSGNVFNVATNWSPASAPSTGADLVFGASSFTNVGFNTAYSANSLTFSGAYPHYFISTFNNSALSIAGGGITVADTSGGGAGYVDFTSALPISLTASQTWTTNGNLSVYGTVSGGFALTKAGNGDLVLDGVNTHAGGTTVNAGTLYVGQTGSAGTGPLALGSTATLGTSKNDVTVSNAVSLASGATLGGSLNNGGGSTLELSGTVTVGSNATTLKIASGADVSFTGTLTGPASTALTIQSGGLAVLIGPTSNMASFTADGSAIVFGNVNALPATSIGAINGGYVSIANLVGVSPPTAPTVAQLLAKITNQPAFDGTLGFDTDREASTVHTYDLSSVDLSGFTHANFKIGSATAAVLTGAITTPGQSYNFGGFGDQGGGLFVQSNLGNKNAATTSVTIDSPNSTSGGLSVIFQGNNTFTGNITVSKSAVGFDSATALPSGSNFPLGAIPMQAISRRRLASPALQISRATSSRVIPPRPFSDWTRMDRWSICSLAARAAPLARSPTTSI